MSKLKNLPRVDLPREKLAKYGKEKLSDKELLAIILGSGIEGLNVLQLSQKILIAVKKIGVEKITLEDFLKIKGLGRAKASQVISTLELGKRLSSGAIPQVISPKDIWMQCIDIRDSKREHLVAFYLDARGKIIEKRTVSVGILDASLVHPREVFEPAVRNNAHSVIVAHNHPSGDTEPSQADIDVTKRLIHAGKILDIRLLDHIIVTSGEWLKITAD